ncbi:hypothetical protein PACILC2_52490 [Paenibacillus cisolokensis]|uniref:Uncharacterized protein n=1 Tax=Paenibacillus cisolokensis TaxID=1658519 RepID=A0ABQ4NES7_9BACL|nr:hypothetical protein PACILC2_52490 [Paenibacillus cisolokensis]
MIFHPVYIASGLLYIYQSGGKFIVYFLNDSRKRLYIGIRIFTGHKDTERRGNDGGTRHDNAQNYNYRTADPQKRRQSLDKQGGGSYNHFNDKAIQSRGSSRGLNGPAGRHRHLRSPLCFLDGIHFPFSLSIRMIVSAL